MLQVDSATYATFEASNLQNVEFFDSTGMLIPSWLESGASSSSVNTIYWLKLSTGVPASSSITVYMGFGSLATNLFNSQTTGEAPQLSSTYGQYDTGSKVFPYYQSWGSLSALPNGWIFTGQAQASFSPTHTTLTDSDTSAGGNDGVTSIAPTSSISFPSIVEYYANQSLGAGGYSEVFGLGSSVPGPGREVAAGVLEHNGSPALGLDIADVPYDSTAMDTPQNNVFTLAISSRTSASLLFNYNPTISETNTGAIIPTTLGIFWHVQFCCQRNYPFNIYWLRTRAYPPNGVMPAATFSSPTRTGSQSSIQSNFNSQTISAGSYVWFNSVIKLQSPVPLNGLSVFVTGQTITLNLEGGGVLTLKVPDAEIDFSTTATAGTTTFDNSNHKWITVVPAGFGDNDFLSGLAYLVPVGVSLAGANPVIWSGTFSGSASFSVHWQFAAAVYTSFSTDYNALGVKPLHSTSLDAYHNGDQAGTPENFKASLVAGAMGGGGSNFTGSYSPTESVSYTKT
jgi:hypothetical protein